MNGIPQFPKGHKSETAKKAMYKYYVLVFEDHTDRGNSTLYGPYNDYMSAKAMLNELLEKPENIAVRLIEYRKKFHPLEINPLYR